jgi:CRP/FNR family transcriptional regulator, cyclic AMP receptor protein
MAESANGSTDDQLLDALEKLGDGTAFAEQIVALVGRSQFFAEFDRDDIALLARYMQIYRAQAGQALIREGNIGDYMLLVIEGSIAIYKASSAGAQQHMTTVSRGRTLGEMSMIDGEPRFATCIAAEPSVFGVLSRDNMVRIVIEKPSLGAKILIKLVTMLSQRLRQTSAELLQYKK